MITLDRLSDREGNTLISSDASTNVPAVSQKDDVPLHSQGMRKLFKGLTQRSVARQNELCEREPRCEFRGYAQEQFVVLTGIVHARNKSDALNASYALD